MRAKPKKKSEKQIVSDFNNKYNSKDEGSGKGDFPRSIFSDKYKKNYDSIFRKNSKTEKNIKTKKGE
jgi:hypothetical protein